jgi:TRAP-type C4-dicarboxylate transport system permease small subunit
MVTLFIIMGLTVSGVICRIMGVPISGITNLSESLLVIGIYLGTAYAQKQRQHVAVEFLLASLNRGGRKVLGIVDLIVALLITSIVILASWDYAFQSWGIKERMDGAPFYPIYPPKIAIAIGMTLLGIQLLCDVIQAMFQSTSE